MAAGLASATTEKVAVLPAFTLALAGWVVMVSHCTVRVAAVLVASGLTALVATARNWAAVSALATVKV